MKSLLSSDVYVLIGQMRHGAVEGRFTAHADSADREHRTFKHTTTTMQDSIRALESRASTLEGHGNELDRRITTTDGVAQRNLHKLEELTKNEVLLKPWHIYYM